MRIARFTTGDEPRYAMVEGEAGSEELVVLSGDPMYVPGKPTGERVPLDGDGVRLLAPVIPRSKTVCLGRNYPEHVAELGNVGSSAADQPLFFLKPNTAVIGPDDPIVLPDYSREVHLEAELAVVVGRLAKNITPENAASYIYGYTCANDVTARDVQATENQWFRAKAFDTSLPLGPWIETELDADDLAIESRINDAPAQGGNTREMVWDPLTALALASEVVTLLPGDVLLTGTPAGVTAINHGDRVEVTIEGIGTLMNPVVRR